MNIKNINTVIFYLMVITTSYCFLFDGIIRDNWINGWLVAFMLTLANRMLERQNDSWRKLVQDQYELLTYIKKDLDELDNSGEEWKQQ